MAPTNKEITGKRRAEEKMTGGAHAVRLILKFAERRPDVQTEKFNIRRAIVWNAEDANALRTEKFSQGRAADLPTRRADARHSPRNRYNLSLAAALAR